MEKYYSSRNFFLLPLEFNITNYIITGELTTFNYRIKIHILKIMIVGDVMMPVWK